MDPGLMENYEKEIGVHFTDSLTGLFNHGFFQISLEQEVKRFERHGDQFAMLLIDIDFISRYNRSHGHVHGDIALKKVAGLIKENIRQVDFAARYAGDVFAVILFKAKSEPAQEVAERIRQSVITNFDGEITISTGIASFPADASNRTGLIEKAHDALKQAKLRGKDRIYCFKNKSTRTDHDKSRILVVDDDPLNIKLLKGLLIPLNYDVITACSGEEAIAVMNKTDVDLVLLDIMMPDMDGYEVCRHIKGKEDTRLVPVVMVTALDDMDAKVRGIEVGADDFITKPPNKIELLARAKSLISVKTLNNNLTSIENVLFSLANAVEAKDSYTQGHTQRVSDMAVTIGKKMSLPEHEIRALEFGGVLHDIGKIGVAGNVLNKQGPLNSDELEIMKRHPEIGYNICLPLKKTIGMALDIIRHHHEKLDGSGYPDGLKGEEISKAARIMAIVDIYDALVTDRPYRKGMSREKAMSILHQDADEGKLDMEVIEQLP